MRSCNRIQNYPGYPGYNKYRHIQLNLNEQSAYWYKEQFCTCIIYKKFEKIIIDVAGDKQLRKKNTKYVIKRSTTPFKSYINIFVTLIGLRTSNHILKTLTIITLVIGLISYAAQIVPLVSAYELSPPNKNLQVQWWDWILGIPASNSPVLDETGEDCAVDQRGPVWYLAGFAG